MTISLPPELEVTLQAIADRQGKDINAIVIEILTQSLATDSNATIPKQPKFMRFAGIAAEEAGLLISLEEDVNRDSEALLRSADRTLDLQRQVDL